MEHIRSEFISATASRLEAIENRVNELGPQMSANDEVLKGLTGFKYKKGSNKASFSGVISSQTYNFAKQMLDDMEDEKEIHISVNSPGGSAVTGVALQHLFNEADQHIEMTATGQAYSAAGVMMQGADKRKVAPGSYIGVHRSWVKTSGNESDFSRMAAELRKNDENILEIFSAVVPDHKMGKFKELMEKDTAMSGKEAVAMGIADEALARRTTKSSKPAASKEIHNEAPQGDASKNYEILAAKLDSMIAMFKPQEAPAPKEEPKAEKDDLATAKEIENRALEAINQVKEMLAENAKKAEAEVVVNVEGVQDPETFEKTIENNLEGIAEAVKDPENSKKGPTRHFQLSVPLN